MYYQDEWPVDSSGVGYDGKNLLDLVRSGKSPFDGVWDVNLLIREVEENLATEITDIPLITKGSNNYGYHMTTSNGPNLVARLARGDVNMPGFDGFPIKRQAPEVKFEAACYNLLRQEPEIRVSELLYHRIPVLHPGPKLSVPQDLAGRRLLVFKESEGQTNVWGDLTSSQRLKLLDALAHIRAALFSYEPPLDFTKEYLLQRLFQFMPESLSRPIEPTREFWVHVLEEKIKATIRNKGDMIGWESDEETVGPRALAAKGSLLRAVQLILPPETPDSRLYRFVLEHGDFGIHNTTIAKDESGQPFVTSLFDWETGCIWPAILSDTEVAACPVDLITAEDGSPDIKRVPKDASSADLAEYRSWADHYIKKLYHDAAAYQATIQAGKDFRYLWYKLRDWRGRDPENFFGDLGAWAERLIKEKEDR